MCLVDIVQHIWQMGEIPQEFGWAVLVLVLKRTTYTRGIGLLETLWKLVEALIDTRLRASLQLYDVIHGLGLNRDGGGNKGSEARARAIQHITRPPLPGIP